MHHPGHAGARFCCAERIAVRPGASTAPPCSGPPGCLPGLGAHEPSAPHTARHARSDGPGDLDQQLLISHCPRRAGTGLGGIVGPRGDGAAAIGGHPADRFDPEPVFVGVDEPITTAVAGRAPARGNSRRPTNSLARLNSFTSCSRSLIRSPRRRHPGSLPGIDPVLLDPAPKGCLAPP
jgi:hypothetical protein